MDNYLYLKTKNYVKKILEQDFKLFFAVHERVECIYIIFNTLTVKFTDIDGEIIAEEGDLKEDMVDLIESLKKFTDQEIALIQLLFGQALILRR